MPKWYDNVRTVGWEWGKDCHGAYTLLRWFSTTSNTSWGKEASARG